MADASDRSTELRAEEELKYLEFVEPAALKALVCFSSLYGYAKEKSGPLRTGVESVEGTVKAVVGPVYQRFRAVPLQFIRFADRKVDKTICKVNKRLPPVVKEASSQVYWAARKAPEVARSVASEVQRAGVKETATGVAKTLYANCEPVAWDLYAKYEPVAEKYAVTTWVTLNRLPLFPEVAQILVLTVAYCSGKYNEAVRSTASKGCAVSTYLPLIPVERIAKVFSEFGHSSLKKNVAEAH